MQPNRKWRGQNGLADNSVQNADGGYAYLDCGQKTSRIFAEPERYIRGSPAFRRKIQQPRFPRCDKGDLGHSENPVKRDESEQNQRFQANAPDFFGRYVETKAQRRSCIRPRCRIREPEEKRKTDFEKDKPSIRLPELFIKMQSPPSKEKRIAIPHVYGLDRQTDAKLSDPENQATRANN